MNSKDIRGMASVEAAVILPAIFLVVCLIIIGARLYWAKAQLADAVSAGARAASGQCASCVDPRVRQVVESDLATSGSSCRNLKVWTDSADGFVRASASCQIDMTQIGDPRLTLTQTAREKIDSFRSSTCEC